MALVAGGDRQVTVAGRAGRQYVAALFGRSGRQYVAILAGSGGHDQQVAHGCGYLSWHVSYYQAHWMAMWLLRDCLFSCDVLVDGSILYFSNFVASRASRDGLRG